MEVVLQENRKYSSLCVQCTSLLHVITPPHKAPKIAFQWTAALLHTPDVQGSNIGPNIGYFLDFFTQVL